ncbi:hypothetical protein Q3C01_40090 [Bradyrhizobium sp. UFLA05-109]
MKLFTGWMAAVASVLAVSAADAQVLANGGLRGPATAVSDFDGPYGPPEAPPPRPYGYGYEYEPAPSLLPATEVYAVLRENGFSPLGIPRLRGLVYTIAVVDRRGDDGRLVIDARDGRILRFMPAFGPGFGMGPAHEEGAVAPYGPQGALPPPTVIRSAAPRPPASIPHVASRTVPIPKSAPPRGETPVAAASSGPEPRQARAEASQQAAAAQAKPSEAVPQAGAPTVGQTKPVPTILPTQDMPAAQGLE